MGYKYFYLKVNKMKGKWFVISILVLGSFSLFNPSPSHAQKAVTTLTLLYSNNINGEIDPCPT
jgi:membrane-bound acyltransferase YfiQ involved in biofilm formation